MKQGACDLGNRKSGVAWEDRARGLLFVSERKEEGLRAGGSIDPEEAVFKFCKEGWEIHILLYAGSCFINGDTR